MKLWNSEVLFLLPMSRSVRGAASKVRASREAMTMVMDMFVLLSIYQSSSSRPISCRGREPPSDCIERLSRPLRTWGDVVGSGWDVNWSHGGRNTMVHYLEKPMPSLLNHCGGFPRRVAGSTALLERGAGYRVAKWTDRLDRMDLLGRQASGLIHCSAAWYIGICSCERLERRRRGDEFVLSS